MIFEIALGLFVAAYIIYSLCMRPSAIAVDGPTSTGSAKPKPVLLSPDAQVFLRRYGFSNSYCNNNAITICCDVVSGLYCFIRCLWMKIHMYYILMVGISSMEKRYNFHVCVLHRMASIWKTVSS